VTRLAPLNDNLYDIRLSGSSVDSKSSLPTKKLPPIRSFTPAVLVTPEKKVKVAKHFSNESNCHLMFGTEEELPSPFSARYNCL
jgi:hypothetical protein